MKLYVRKELAELILDTSNTGSPRRVAVAYVSDTRVSLGQDDTLVVQASPNAMQSGATSKQALLAYHRAGVKVFNHPTLHAKLYRFGDHTIIGSPNMSNNALTAASFEAAVHTEDADVADEVDQVIDQLINNSTALDEAAIKALPEPEPDRRQRPTVAESDGTKLIWYVNGRAHSAAAETDEAHERLPHAEERVLMPASVSGPQRGDQVSVLEGNNFLPPRKVTGSDTMASGEIVIGLGGKLAGPAVPAGQSKLPAQAEDMANKNTPTPVWAQSVW